MAAALVLLATCYLAAHPARVAASYLYCTCNYAYLYCTCTERPGSMRERRERVAAALFSRIVARAAHLDDSAQASPASPLTFLRTYYPPTFLRTTRLLTYCTPSYLPTYLSTYLLTLRRRLCRYTRGWGTAVQAALRTSGASAANRPHAREAAAPRTLGCSPM